MDRCSRCNRRKPLKREQNDMTDYIERTIADLNKAAMSNEERQLNTINDVINQLHHEFGEDKVTQVMRDKLAYDDYDSSELEMVIVDKYYELAQMAIASHIHGEDCHTESRALSAEIDSLLAKLPTERGHWK